VELLVPIEDAACRDRLVAILDTYFQDTVKARRLLPDGSYERVTPSGKHKPLRSQETLYREACEAVKRAVQSQPTIFEPHRAPGA
jgi:polyphosphate kinase